jgi:hypothetical protein
MAATRLSDAQKQELVARYRAGEGTNALADAFGCSPNTVTRTVRSALGADAYERLKRERAAPAPAAVAVPAVVAVPAAVGAEPPERDETDEVPAVDVADDAPGVLAIDDADDFAVDGEDDTDDDGEDDDLNVFVPVPLLAGAAAGGGAIASCQPLEAAALPASLYMLVDKTVELQARPLSEFPELGALPEEEQQRQALVVFANPRQAKRQCGRTQRVIKLPDSQVIRRTAPYLLGQGITRLVLEGAVYALPGSS